MTRTFVVGLGLSLAALLPVRSSLAAVIAPLGRWPVPEMSATPANLLPIAEALRSGDVDPA